MEEKRHSQRSELTSTLVIKRLDSADAGMQVTIDITDVSKGGVGFTCSQALEIGAVYESFLEIIRIEKKGDVYFYGSSFVGLPEMDAQRIGVYQTIQDMNK